ncbi:MAG TPA: hypothetical protein VIL13_04830 [Longimicrobiales bacterium]|jgi:uncharacterized membrane protein YjjP (DUF1212 family)
MSPFRPSRARRGPDPYLRWKIALFSAGAALALAGIATENDRLILAAIGVLAVGILLRVLPRRPER